MIGRATQGRYVVFISSAIAFAQDLSASTIAVFPGCRRLIQKLRINNNNIAGGVISAPELKATTKSSSRYLLPTTMVTTVPLDHSQWKWFWFTVTTIRRT